VVVGELQELDQGVECAGPVKVICRCLFLPPVRGPNVAGGYEGQPTAFVPPCLVLKKDPPRFEKLDARISPPDIEERTLQKRRDQARPECPMLAGKGVCDKDRQGVRFPSQGRR